ncbi:unnamed protein product [marine sediment metagenome]|uniref:DNA-binding protein n=1 Tax=marine sediment metagenome TaxID=412755 RepID=X1B9C5_9ZZZZ
MNEDLERLKKALHPEKPMNIIEQCRIVAEALGSGGDFEEDKYSLAEYLGIGQSKVYKMQRVHIAMLPEVKAWFMKSDYQANTAYEVATLSKESQGFFLKDAKRLNDTIEPTKIEEEG